MADLTSYNICSVATTTRTFTPFPTLLTAPAPASDTKSTSPTRKARGKKKAAAAAAAKQPSSWPERTDIHCWNCTLSFETRPVSAPVDETNFTGVFCSWNCAKRFILEERRSNLQYQLLRLAVLANCDVTPSPPRYMLSKFGGEMSVEAYRACHDHVDIIEENYKESRLTVARTKATNGRHDGLYYEYLRLRTMNDVASDGEDNRSSSSSSSSSSSTSSSSSSSSSSSNSSRSRSRSSSKKK